jgi:CHAT domain-containing protein
VFDKLKRHSETFACLREALQIAEQTQDQLAIGLINTQIGIAHVDQKQWTEAEQPLRLAIKHLELVRGGARETSLQTSFLGKHSAAYYHLATALVELGRADEAFVVNEQARSRSLLEMIQSGRGDVHKSMSADERHEEQQLETKLASLGSELRAAPRNTKPEKTAALRDNLSHAQLEYDAFRRRLYLAHPQLQTERGDFEPATLTVLNEGLFARDPRLCVLSYVACNDQTYLFVLERGDDPHGPARIKAYTLPPIKGELKESVERFRMGCQSPGGRTDADGARLYRELVAPAEGDLAGKEQLVIISDRNLHAVPFHAFQDAQGKYLLEKHAFSYAPSVTALLKIVDFRDRRTLNSADDAPELLAVGRPTFESDLKDLPATESEVLKIASMFGPRAQILLGSQATETAVKQAMLRPRILHFATHGLLNETAPLYSSIALTKGEHDDGRLEAREILDMNLQAELTVLSACQTARGQEVNGEGVLGLTWSLFAAGSPSSVVTLWSVSDKATSSLMVEFYRRLRSSPAPTKAEALRQAQLWLIREAPQQPGLVRGLDLGDDLPAASAPQQDRLPPYYWAPFQLLGDWR